jgi:tetratricopeptide (TPR) repeat protein
VEQHHAILSELDEATPPLRALREHAGDERVATELRRRLADTFREAPVERPMLLVVDDVPEPAAGEPPPPLETWCPAPDAVACLTTSRAAVRFEGGTDLTQITLPVLDPEPAVDVLTGGDVDRAALAHDEWLRIARWVGHLPLALTLLNSAMSGEFEPLPPRDVLGAADAGRSPTKELDRAMDALRDVVPKGALRGVSEAFTLSYELLPEDARVAARTLAELAPEPIPRQLLDALGGPCADARVQALVRARSFVLPARAEKGSPTVPMFGVMHAVLADFLRSRPDETASGAYASAARRALLSVMTSERCLDPTSWPLLRTCLPHAEWLIAAGQAGGGVRDESDAEQPVALWMRVGLFLWARGDLAGGRRAEEAGARLAERRLGPDHDVTLSILANLGVSLLALGDLAASRALHERVLAARMRRLGPEHHDTLVSTNYLAYVLLGQGDAAGARVLSERAVAVQRRTLGEEHSDTLESMTYLANSLAVLGDLAEARALLTRVVEARTRQLGAEHRETLTSMNDLADVLLRQGDAAGARPLAERVLSGYTRLLGDEHPYTLTSMDNLASILRALGDAARALPLQERVVEARRHLLGAEHPHTLTSMHNLGSTLRDLGRAADARRVFEETLRVRRRVLGDAHPSTHNTRRTLRALLEELGDTDAARALDAS